MYERELTVVTRRAASRSGRSWAPILSTSAAAALWTYVVLEPPGWTALRFAVLTLTLGVAGRAAYVKVSAHGESLSLVSGWVVALALASALALSPLRALVTGIDADPAGSLALGYGLVEPGQQVTAIDRCVARRLRAAASDPASATTQRASSFYRRVCDTVLQQGLLLESGVVLDRARLSRIEQDVRLDAP